MRRYSRYVFGCGGAAFAIASFLAGLEVSATTAAPSLSQNAPAVNRTVKGDRMPVISVNSRNAVNGPVELSAPPAPTPRPRLPDGCEPVISAIGQTPLAQIPGRCIS
jgi:hypothetical protein